MKEDRKMFESSFLSSYLLVGISLILFLCYLLSLVTIYRSQNKKLKLFCFISSILLFIAFATTSFLFSKSEYLGTSVGFAKLRDSIKFKHELRWSGTEYSLVQKLEENNKPVDRRIIRNVPEGIPIGGIFIINGKNYFLLAGEIKG